MDPVFWLVPRYNFRAPNKNTGIDLPKAQWDGNLLQRINFEQQLISMINGYMKNGEYSNRTVTEDLPSAVSSPFICIQYLENDC